jgi:hypothetical protein
MDGIADAALQTEMLNVMRREHLNTYINVNQITATGQGTRHP